MENHDKIYKLGRLCSTFCYTRFIFLCLVYNLKIKSPNYFIVVFACFINKQTSLFIFFNVGYYFCIHNFFGINYFIFRNSFSCSAILYDWVSLNHGFLIYLLFFYAHFIRLYLTYRKIYPRFFRLNVLCFFIRNYKYVCIGTCSNVCRK